MCIYIYMFLNYHKYIYIYIYVVDFNYFPSQHRIESNSLTITYWLKVPKYRAKIDLIRSFFNDFNCNWVGVAGYVFLFPSLLALKSSA